MGEPKMDTSVMAQTVKPSGSSIPNGTPGKASGLMPKNTPFVSEGIDSDDNTNPFPNMEPYWNAHGKPAMPKGGD